MAALVRSVKVARVLTSRHNILRCLYHSNKTVATLSQPSFLRTGPKTGWVAHVLTRPSSSLAPEVAIIDQQQGRPQDDPPPQRRVNNRIRTTNTVSSPQTLPELVRSLHEITSIKTGIVTPNMITRILKLIVTEGAGSIDARHSAFLLGCTGQALVFTPKKDRASLLKRMLAQYEELGITLTTDHCNAVLKSYTENSVDFNPVEFLANMEAKGASPNRATYQFLIAKFCHDGNVDSASEILQHMKQASIPVGEDIFSSFITGYMKAGNTDKAKQILEVMSASGIEPTGQSYASLLWAYAEKGDIEGIRVTLVEAGSQNIDLEDGDIYAAIMALADNNHKQHIPELLEAIVHRSDIDNFAVIKSLRELVAAGHEDTAVDLFLALNRSNPNIILMPIISMRKPFTSFMNVVNRLDPQCFTLEYMESLAKFVLRSANENVGIEVLYFLQSKGLSIDALSVKRLVTRMRGAGSVETVYKAAAMLYQSHGANTAPLVHDASFASRLLLERVESIEDMHAKLKALGYAESELPMITFLGYLRAGQFPAAVKYGDENSAGIQQSCAIDADSAVVKEVMLQGYRNSGRKLGAMLEAIQQCSAILRLQVHRLNSDMLLRFSSLKDTSAEDIENYLKLAQEKDLKVLSRYKRNLLKELGVKQVSQQVVGMLDRVVPAEEKVPGMAELQKLPTQELEKLLPRVTENGNLLQIANVSRVLIRRYCAAEKKEENARKVAQLTQVMESNQSTYDFMTLKALVNFYTGPRKDLARTMKYYGDLTTKFRNYKDTFRLVLTVATAQAEGGQVAEAFSTIQDHLDSVASTDEFTKSKSLAGLCVRLLQSLRNKEDVDRMYELLVKGFVAENTYGVMKGVIKAHMKADAAEAVVEDILKFSNEHKIDPDQDLLGEVLSFLIERKDEERLEKVTSIVSASKGQGYVQHALVKELLVKGNTEEAKKALSNCEPEPNMALMNRICNSFFREKKVDAMKRLMEISKSMKGVDREQMIFWLLKLHVKMENSTEALNTFVMFQEENITPQRRTLRMVGELLNSLDVTALPPQLLDAALAQSEKTEDKLEEVIAPEEDVKQEVAPDAVPQNAEATDPNPVTAPEPTAPSPSTNQVQELILNLKANPALLSKYCTAQNLKIVSKHCPELERELESMVLSQAEPKPDVVENLARFYLENGRMTDTKALIEKHVGLFKNPTELYEAMPETLLLETKSMFGQKDDVAMFERLVVLKCEAGDWKGGLEHYQESLKEDLVLPEDTLTVLETMLRINNQPVPW